MTTLRIIRNTVIIAVFFFAILTYIFAQEDLVQKSFSCYQTDASYGNSYGGGIILKYDPNVASSFAVSRKHSEQITISHYDTGKGVFRVSWMSSEPIDDNGSPLFDVSYYIENEEKSGSAITSFIANSFSKDGEKILDPETGTPGLKIVENTDSESGGGDEQQDENLLY